MRKEKNMIRKNEINNYKLFWSESEEAQKSSIQEYSQIDEHVEKMKKLLGRRVVWDEDYGDIKDETLIGKEVMTIKEIGWTIEFEEPVFYCNFSDDRWYSYQYALENLLVK
tara:strand:- start:87 stop:419 length:333 start_codon:yes stop_codon:yes gene_type:complete